MKRTSIALLIALVAGCSAMAPEETGQTDESALRALTAEEILGDIAYGETKKVDLTPAPKYRAFSFEGTRGDTIEARVIAEDGTDPILWLTDAAFSTVALSDNPRPTDTNPLIGRTLLKSGTYFLVFREMTFAPRAKFSVSITKTGSVPLECDPDGEGFVNPDCAAPLGFDPFDPASCSGPALTAAEATKKLGNTGDLTDAKIYYRTRQCSVTEGCSPWVRAHGMDIPLTTLAATPNGWSIIAAAPRAKVKVDFAVDPGTMTRFCVDGPFATLKNSSAWSVFEDGTPGVCGASLASTPAVTATCARFEPSAIELGSSDSTRTTEYGAVLLARY